MLGGLISGCGSPSPWQSSPLPAATPVPPGAVGAVPTPPNTSPSATSSASGMSPARPPSH
ncbi:MAG TPA: hypothetical protein VF112_01995 [Candidatus Dormibacteraeota bacterium]